MAFGIIEVMATAHTLAAEKRIMNHKGFTLMELVMVIVLIAIVAVFVAPRLGDVTAMKAGAFTSKLRADIRYAQNLAMTRNRRARVYFNGTGTAPNPGYAVVVDSGAGDCSAFVAAADPSGGGNLTVTLNAGDYTGITVPFPSINCLEYDSLGRPFNCSGALGVCSSTSAGMTADVNNDATMRVTVTVQTGAVN